MQYRERIFFFLVIGFCALVLQPLAFPLVTGMVLGFLCENPTDKVFQRFQLKSLRARWLAAFGFVSVVQGLFIVPLVLLTWTATTELLKFWNGLSGDDSAAETGYKILAWLDRMATPLFESAGLPISFADVNGKLRDMIQPILRSLVGYVGNILSSTPELILFLVVSWMAWVYFLVHGRAQRQALLPRLLPWSDQREVLAKTLSGVLRALVLTSIVLSLVQSLMVLISLGVLGIPKFYLWGALSFFLSFVPVVGTAPVMISAAVYCFYQDRPIAGSFILGMAVCIGLIDNILRPFLMKGSTEMNFFWLFLAIVGGVGVFGVPGVVLGPWAFSLFMAVQDMPQKAEY